MNFSRKEVEKRTKKLTSGTPRRLRKLQLIGIRLFLIGFVFVACLGISSLFGAFQSIVDTAPDISSIQVIPQGYTTKIKNTKGKTIQKLVGKDANREYVTLDKIPADLQNAFVAIEDERFWTHNGIDMQGIIRAGVTGLKNGKFNQGASTLTQQLLKNQVFGGGEEATLFARIQRKVQEQFLAIKLEETLDKKQILEYYLNTINMGQNTLGVQAASKRYFNKSVSELTLSECAVLAGITQNPSAYNPISHPKNNKEKRLIVLTYMKEQGYITSEEYSEALKDNVYKRIKAVNKETVKNASPTSYFTDALIAQVIRDLKQKLGYTETQAYNALYSGGLTIYSTQDSSMQKICDSVINNSGYYPADSKYQLGYQLTVQHKDETETNYSFETMKKWYKKKKNTTISTFYTSKKVAKKIVATYRKAVVKKSDTIIGENISLVIQPQASFVLIDQNTGYVKAICGGRGEKTASRTLNRATDSARQPGSTFKILSTYLPALDTSGMTLATVQDDAKYYYPGTKRLVKNWYGSSYRGLTSLREAIEDSMNVVAVKTLAEVTPKTGYDYLLNLGFTTLVENETSSTGANYTDIALPMALGGLTKGVTNLELTNGFATIANGGTYREPTFYSKIVDHNGNVLLKYSKDDSEQVIKDSTAWLLTSAMKDVVNQGTGTALKFYAGSNIAQAGKTGTTTDNKDVWFVGYTPYLTAGIWGGYDANISQNSSSYHKTMWRTIMQRIHAKYKAKDFRKPDSITTATICTTCGKLAIKGLCNAAVGGSCMKKEYFSIDSVPTEKCDCHVKCKICKSSGHLAGDNCPADKIYTAVYLQKKESSKTADSSLISPKYLANSTCQKHN